MMKNVSRLIEASGYKTNSTTPVFHISIENEPFMRLVIEGIGQTPEGCQLVSVAHYGEQNGDLMRDPEVVFFVDARGWHPVSIQQDYMGSYREAIRWNWAGDPKVNKRESDGIASFAKLWDRNIGAQGFVKAHARELAS